MPLTPFSLPTIIEQVNAKAREIDEELASLPEPPRQDILRTITTHLSSFTRQVQAAVDPLGPPNPFQRRWRSLRLQFRDAIYDQRPTLVPRAREEHRRDSRQLQRSQNQIGSPGTPSPFQSFTKAVDAISIQSDSENESQQTPCKSEAPPISVRKRVLDVRKNFSPSPKKPCTRSTESSPFASCKG